MKIIETYQCDFCNMEFDTKAECKGCEGGHAGIDTLGIVEVNHHRNESRNFPDNIIIKSSRTSDAVGIYTYTRSMGIDETYWEMRKGIKSPPKL
jgi:hypothetical protein